jgi:hypothetical protein
VALLYSMRGQGAVRIGMAAILSAVAITVSLTGSWSANAATPQGKGTEKPVQQAPSVTCPSGQCFADVVPGSTFYDFVNHLYINNIVTGYACGGAGEPCDGSSRPYYRPGAGVTRGSMSKFVDLARPKPGLVIDAKAANGEYFAMAGFRDAPGTNSFDGDAAILGVNSGSGLDGTHPSPGIRAMGIGAANSVGMYATSSTGAAAWFDTSVPTGSYGTYILHGGMLVGTTVAGSNLVTIRGPLVVQSGCTGCFLTGIMKNTGASAVHPGEVVSMSGEATGEMVGDSPVGGAEAASTAYSTGVVGVVAQRWIPADPNAAADSKAGTGYVEEATTIKPGEYMTVVSSGAYKSIKVDASNGPIHAGDLLTTSNTAGVAMKVTNKMDAFGAVIGKAMGDLESGTGEIPVLITLK